jgi:uncharacterized protein YbjT (DUF2867 family)
MKKNVCVLGGTGFVGLHLCEKLVRAGWQVTVATRRRSQAREVMVLPGLTVQEVDVHDEAALSQLLAGHDAVVNLVAILHGSQADFEHVHVALPKKLAHACVHQGVSRVVHVSALGADALQPQNAPSMYLRSKGEGEAVLLQAAQGLGAGEDARAGFDVSIVRPSVIFGAGDRFLTLFAKLQQFMPVMLLAGSGARFQPVWVQDVATALVALLEGYSAEPSPRTLEACGPSVYTLGELVRLSGQLAGLCGGYGRWVLPLPLWAGRLQAAMLSLLPGPPLMSADNLDSMRVDNVASGRLPGLQSLGIRPGALPGIARDYLR